LVGSVKSQSSRQNRGTRNDAANPAFHAGLFPVVPQEARHSQQNSAKKSVRVLDLHFRIKLLLFNSQGLRKIEASRLLTAF